MIVVAPLADAAAVHVDAAGLAALAAPYQAEPERFQAYFGDTVHEIAAEITDFTAWRDATTLALDGGELVGWLLAEHDEEVGRVWWWGPVVAADHDWIDVGERLLDAALDGIAGRFDQFEFAVDARHVDAAALAERRGYRRDLGSVLLRRDLTEPPPAGESPASHTIVVPDESHADAVAAMHDEVFPNTHLTGAQLVESANRDVVLIAITGERAGHGDVAGYVRAEIQPAGGGYLDFLGVAASHRNAGVGRALVERAVSELATRGARNVSLTVREDNAPARTLYRRLGFDGSRILVPFRLGFTP